MAGHAEGLVGDADQLELAGLVEGDVKVTVSPPSTTSSMPSSSTVKVWNSVSPDISKVMVSPTLKVKSLGTNLYSPVPPVSWFWTLTSPSRGRPQRGLQLGRAAVVLGRAVGSGSSPPPRDARERQSQQGLVPVSGSCACRHLIIQYSRWTPLELRQYSSWEESQLVHEEARRGTNLKPGFGGNGG